MYDFAKDRERLLKELEEIVDHDEPLTISLVLTRRNALLLSQAINMGIFFADPAEVVTYLDAVGVPTLRLVHANAKEILKQAGLKDFASYRFSIAAVSSIEEATF